LFKVGGIVLGKVDLAFLERDDFADPIHFGAWRLKNFLVAGTEAQIYDPSSEKRLQMEGEHSIPT
jgi:hypothetical protein